jgi:hypothetical protein
MFRAQSANDYYVVRANALDNSVLFYRVDKGKRSQLAGKEIPIEADKWHSLRVIAANDRFEVALDGKTLFDVTDRSLLQSGAMGVWSQADSSPTTAPCWPDAGALRRGRVPSRVMRRRIRVGQIRAADRVQVGGDVQMHRSQDFHQSAV